VRPTASKVEAVTGSLLRLWVFLGMLAVSTPIPVVRLGIDPTQMVELIRSVAKGDIARIKRGELPSLAVPYRLEGTSWVAVEGFGRLAAGFGPTTGEWALR
jgi:hypothetical protein